MTVEFPVTLANDICAGVNTHFTIPPLPPMPSLSLEMLTNMKESPGYQLGKNKIADNVTLNGMGIVLDGHDVGMNRADFTPMVPVNPLYAVIWLNASRKTLFSAAKVTMSTADTPVAGVSMTLSMPMLTCGDPVALPSMFSLSNAWNQCVVGFEASDLVAGWLAAGSAVAIDLIAFAINGWPGGTSTSFWGMFGGDLTKFGAGASDRGSIVKLVLGPILDGGVSYVRGRMNGTNDWSIRWTVGGPLLGGEYSVGSSGGGPVVHRFQGSAFNYQHAYSTADRRWTTQRQSLPWDGLRLPTPSLNARRDEPGALR